MKRQIWTYAQIKDVKTNSLQLNIDQIIQLTLGNCLNKKNVL